MKRKIENSTLVETKKPKGDDHVAVDGDPVDRDSGEENEVPQFKGPLKVKDFRKKLQSDDFIAEYYHFLQKAEKNTKVVSAYLEAGGQPFEIVMTLEKLDKTALPHINCVFQVLQLVLIEILTNSTQHTEVAVNGCRFLLNKHRNCIEKLLDSSVAQYKVSVIKLLTAIVALDARLGYDVLKLFRSIVQTDFQLAHLTRINQKQDDGLRSCFIHFVMSFFIEGNNVLIRNIMAKPELIQSVLIDLHLDQDENIVLVLGTLKSYMLKHYAVTKVQKFQVFDHTIVGNLLKIYERADKEEASANLILPINDFLILLLSSYRFGIAIENLGDKKTKYNAVPREVLRELSKIRRTNSRLPLIVQILKACPNLCGFFLSSLAKGIDPEKAEAYLEVLEYIETIIGSLSPKAILRQNLETVRSSEIAKIIKEICLNADILNKIKEKGLVNDVFEVRLATIKLLNAQFIQLKVFFKNLSTYSGYKNVKFDVFGHAFTHMAPVDKIVHSLYQSIDNKSIPRPHLLVHIETTIDLLLVVVETVPAFIEKTLTLVNYLQILNPIYNDRKGEDLDNQSRIELKTIKLILLLDPQALTANSELFKQILVSFLNVLPHGDSASQREVHGLLRNMLLNTGLFENGKLEVDIWLDCLRSVDLQHLSVVQQFFVKTVLNVKESGEPDAEELIVDLTSKDGGIGMILTTIENGEIVEGVVEVPVTSTMLTNALKTSKKNIQIQKFLEAVVFKFIHYLPTNQLALVGELLKKKGFLTENYLLGWFEQSSVVVPDEYEHPILSQVLGSILKEEYKPIEAFKDVNVTGLICHIYGVLFFVNQTIRLDKCTKKSIEVAAKYLIELLELVKATDENDASSGTDNDNSNLYAILKYIYQSQIELFQYFNLFKSDYKANYLIQELVEYTTKTNYTDLTRNYRCKFIKQLKCEANVERLQTNGEEIIKFIRHFAWTGEECIRMIEVLIELNSGPVECEVLPTLIIDILNKFAAITYEDSKAKLNQETLTKIFVILEGVVEQGAAEIIDNFCETITVVLKRSFVMPELQPKLITILYEREKVTKPVVTFLSLVLENDIKNNGSTFKDLLATNYQRKEITYPLLNAVCEQPLDIDRELLSLLYQEYKSGILKSIEKPNKAAVIYKECTKASNYLIKNAMPLKDCNEFCRKLVKSDVVEVFQIKFIKTIHQKAVAGAKDDAQKEQFVQHYVSALFNFFHIQFKRNDMQKMDCLVKEFVDWMTEYHNPDRNWEEVCQQSNWTGFMKNCIKIGMQAKTEDADMVILLKLLAFLIERFYAEGEYADLSLVYEMTISHSEFFTIMLGADLMRKQALVRVLFALASRSEVRVFHKNHIPILLGAYTAKASPSDRLILGLMHLYERFGVCLAEFQPFIWGEAAIAHYSLAGMGSFDSMQILEASNADHMFSLIDTNVMKYTLSNYPVWRCLDPLKNIPEIIFDGAELNYTRLERLVENGQLNEVADIDRKIINRKDTVYETGYDPAFIVPLMANIYSAENSNSTVIAAQNGMLALVIEALSSYDPNMRLAAGMALLRYRRQLEGKKTFLDQKLWCHFFSGLSRGLEQIKQKDEQCPRLSHIASVYLAKSTIILTQPLIKMYKPISDYVLCKETYDFATVPNFNFLFLSPDVEHQSYREFMMEIIQEGIKCVEDFDILDMTGVLETLMTFFSCPFANIDTNLRILNIFNAIVRIPAANKIVIQKYGLFPWLNGIIISLEPFYFDTVEALVHLLYNIYYSVAAVPEQYEKQYAECQLRLFCLFKKLTKVLLLGSKTMKSNYSLRIYEKMVTLMTRFGTMDPAVIYGYVSADDVQDFIDMGLTFCTDGNRDAAEFIHELIYMKNNPQCLFDTEDEFSQRLTNGSIDTALCKAIINLRTLIIDWTKNSQNSC